MAVACQRKRLGAASAYRAGGFDRRRPCGNGCRPCGKGRRPCADLVERAAGFVAVFVRNSVGRCLPVRTAFEPVRTAFELVRTAFAHPSRARVWRWLFLFLSILLLRGLFKFIQGIFSFWLSFSVLIRLNIVRTLILTFSKTLKTPVFIGLFGNGFLDLILLAPCSASRLIMFDAWWVVAFGKGLGGANKGSIVAKRMARKHLFFGFLVLSSHRLCTVRGCMATKVITKQNL